MIKNIVYSLIALLIILLVVGIFAEIGFRLRDTLGKKKGLENCGYCEQYPCRIMEPKMIDYLEVKERFGGPLPDEDYRAFVMPYESRKVLDKINQKGGWDDGRENEMDDKQVK